MATVQTDPVNEEVDEWTKPPFLRRVRIRGYKSIAFCDVELKPLTILIGRNAAGKSNFIDALAFLRDAMNYPVAEAANRHGGSGAIRCWTTESPYVEIGTEAEFSSNHVSYRAEYCVRLAIKGRGLIEVECESLRLIDSLSSSSCGFNAQGGNAEWFGLESFQHDGMERESAVETNLQHANGKPSFPHVLENYRPDRLLLGVIGNSPFVDLAHSFADRSGFYNFHPDAIRKVQHFPYGGILYRDGSNLANTIELLGMRDPETISRVRAYLSAVVDEVEGFEFVHYGEYETIRFRMRSGIARRPLDFDAAHMSDGTLWALAALVAVFQFPSGPASLACIEEPETSLHPAAVRALVDALDEATGRTQVLITTHSADLLEDRDLTPGQILVLRNKGGQTQIAPVDSASREIVRKELYTLADLHRQDHLEPDPADLHRQAELARTNGER